MVTPLFKSQSDFENFGNIAEDLRKRALMLPFQATITSTTRTPEYNKMVGGVPNSQHLNGGALDYRIKDLPAAKVFMLKKHFEDAGFQVINEGDHLHVQHIRGATSNPNAELQNLSALNNQPQQQTQQSGFNLGDVPGFGLAAMRGASQASSKVLNTLTDLATVPSHAVAMMTQALGLNPAAVEQQDTLNNLFRSKARQVMNTDNVLAMGPTPFEQKYTDPLLTIRGHEILPSAGQLAYGTGEFLPEMALAAYGVGPAAEGAIKARLAGQGLAPSVVGTLGRAGAASAGGFTGAMLKNEPQQAMVNAVAFPAMQMATEGLGYYVKQAGNYLKNSPILNNQSGEVKLTQQLDQNLKSSELIPTPEDIKKVAEQPTTNELNFQIDKMQVPDAAKNEIKSIAIQSADTIMKQRRGVVSWDMTNKASRDLLSDFDKGIAQKFLNAQPGTSFNAEELNAMGESLAAFAQKTAKLREQVAIDPLNLEAKDSLKNALALQFRMQRTFQGATAEAGRALNIMKRFKTGVDPMDAVMEKVIKGLTPDQVDLLSIKYAAAGADPIKQMMVLKDFAQRTWLDKFIEYSTAVKLYSPTTHEVNFSSNMANTMLAPTERLIGAGVNKVESLITGAQQEMYPSSAFREVYGIIRALPRALKNLFSALGDEDFQLGEQRAAEAVFGHAIKGVKGKIIRTSFRFLNAFDAFARTLNTSGELTYMASNEGIKQGLKGAALKDFIENFIQNPPKEFAQKANDVASEYLLQSDLGNFGQATSNYLNGKYSKGLKLIVPFFKTPVNERKFGLQRSLLALVSPKNLADIFKGGAEDRALALARVAIGSAVGIASTSYALAGNVTGSYPDSALEREQWAREGKTPFSIKLGDSWYPFRRMGPLAVNLAMAASIADSWNRRGELPTSQMISNMVGEVAKQTLDMPYLQGIKNLMDAMTEGGNKALRLASGFVNGEIPFAGTLARSMDKVQRSPETFTDMIKANLPVISESVPPRLDMLGQEIPKPGASTLDRLFNIAPASKDKSNDPLNKLLSETGIQKSSLFSQKVMGVKLPQDIFVKYQKQGGDDLIQKLNFFIQNPKASVRDLLQNSDQQTQQLVIQNLPANIQRIIMNGAGKISKSDLLAVDYLTSIEGKKKFIKSLIDSAGNQAGEMALKEYLPMADTYIQRQFISKQLSEVGKFGRMIKLQELKDRGLFTPAMQQWLDESNRMAQ